MATCCFFGHRDCPETIRPVLWGTLIGLIEKYGVTRFLVGHQGAFDAISLSVLRELEKTYPKIQYDIVLAHMPKERSEYAPETAQHTFLPEGIETVPRRFAVDRCNNWMLQNSDFVVTYVRYATGGAAKFASEAKRLGKVVVEI